MKIKKYQLKSLIEMWKELGLNNLDDVINYFKEAKDEEIILTGKRTK